MLSRLGLVVASGLALALAFPKFDLNLLAWVAFIPLLYAIQDLSLGAVFGYAWLQSLACYLGSLYWVVITLHQFAGLAVWIAILPLLVLAGAMAVQTATALWAGELIARRLKVPLILTLPPTWAAIEWIRSFFPIGFPWNLLGYAAYRNLELIQFAEFTGVYGVSALIICFNVVVFEVLFTRHTRRLQTLSLGALTGAMLAALGFGTLRVNQLAKAPASGRLRVAMVQGNIPQTVKWDPSFLDSSFKVYADQSRMASRHNADLIIWPEAAAAFLFQPGDDYPPALARDADYRSRLLALAGETRDPILFGAPALRIDDGQVSFYNRAYLVSGAGKVEDFYDKIQLVPFGEYVPFRPVLGYFVNRIAHGFGDMIPGQRQTVFDVKGARLGALICYESVFPDLTRRAVKAGADILVNITNDAWYGESSAPYQLLAMAAMRSVETKVPMVRVANTGISAIIRPDGRITAPTPLFERGTEIEDVNYRPERTVYTRVGDLFAELCFALALAGLLAALLRPREMPPAGREGPEDLGSSNGRARTGHGLKRD